MRHAGTSSLIPPKAGVSILHTTSGAVANLAEDRHRSRAMTEGRHACGRQAASEISSREAQRRSRIPPKAGNLANTAKARITK